MKKISLIIADQDTYYIESLANYIRTSDYSNRFEVKLFSQSDSLGEFFTEIEHVNVFLASEKLISNFVLNEKVDTIIILDEYVGDSTEDNEYAHIFKYQPIHNLMSQLLAIHYEKSGEKSKKIANYGGTQILSIYSATGGTGKTTVSYNLAKEIASLDYQVFYLNLELINSTSLLFSTEGAPNSSALLYYLKSNPKEINSKISSFTVKDADTNIDYFNLSPSAEEMNDFSSDEIEALINGLVDLSEYHYIIIDLESSVNTRVEAALKKSNQVIWLLNNDIQSFYKTNYLLEELHGLLHDGTFSENVMLVLNRYTGKIDERLENYELSIDAFLPYVPQWKEVSDGEQLSEVPVFNENVLKLFQSHISMNRGVSSG